MGGGLSIGKLIGRGATGIVREATLDGQPVVAKVSASRLLDEAWDWGVHVPGIHAGLRPH